MIVKMRWDCTGSGSDYHRVTLFVGPDSGHLAHAGVLTLRRDEAIAFHSSLRQGSGIEETEGFSGVLESGWKAEELAAGRPVSYEKENVDES